MSRKLSTALKALTLISFLLLLLPWSSWLGVKMDIMNSLASPSFIHPLGTDSMGRDLLVRFHQSLYNSIVPIWLACTLFTIISIFLSIFLISINIPIIDKFVGFFNTLVISIPITIATLFLSVYFEEICFEILLLTLAVLIFARNYQLISNKYVRSSSLGYWKAHEMLGGSKLMRVIKYGVFRSWKKEIVEMFFIHLQLAFIIEVSLSYLGFGVQEPNPSFGNMFKSHFDLILRGDFYTVFVIVGFMIITLAVPKIIFNLFSSVPYTFQIDRLKTR